MNSDLPNNIELSNGEPNYDEILKDVDFTPFCGFSDSLDKQLDPILARLIELGYSKEFVAKVDVEAALRYHKGLEELIKRHSSK